ncbi:MAG: undecaprenyl/decaprenyl-phosphate alpha-N-acetylglucosaminyl 1-phosphate transferase [Chloroflexi bacterium]|nr:undecaprenyl/decaprenyl-phosphate alpha-N-acetylglucosaminyl 1-phosphate transferase [Chloroflexota bacterium]
MVELIGVLALSALFAFLLVPLGGSMGRRWGILDRPGPLSIHSRAIPRTGGIGLVLALGAGAGAVLWATTGETATLGQLLLPLGLFLLLGLADDAFQLSPRLRLLAEVAIAGGAFLLGFRLGTVPALALSLPLTLLILVGSANAINLLDGMNGLAAGVGGLGGIFLALLGLAQGEPMVVVVGGALAGACLGFLPHNVGKARVFLGDGGSLSLGFTLGTLVVMLSGESGAWRWPVAAGLALGLPAFDLTYAILRRVQRRVSIFVGDRDHVYDLLHRSGMGEKRVVLLMFGASVVSGLSALTIPGAPLAVGLGVVGLEALALSLFVYWLRRTVS